MILKSTLEPSVPMAWPASPQRRETQRRRPRSVVCDAAAATRAGTAPTTRRRDAPSAPHNSRSFWPCAGRERQGSGSVRAWHHLQTGAGSRLQYFACAGRKRRSGPDPCLACSASGIPGSAVHPHARTPGPLIGRCRDRTPADPAAALARAGLAWRGYGPPVRAPHALPGHSSPG